LLHLQVPPSARTRHLALHRDLGPLLHRPGAVGTIAHDISRILHRHFLATEQLVLPPLSLLPRLAEGRLPAGTDEAIATADRLREALPQLRQNHRELLDALDRLVRAGGMIAGSDEAAFARHVKEQLHFEEEILLPMGAVLGAYLRSLRANSWES
jgi:hypothetical protein